MNTKVVSTSTSCLDYYSEAGEIDLIRIKIYIDGKEYIDGENLSAYEFYEILNKNPKLVPKTSQISVGELVNYFKKLAQQGYKRVLVTTISAQLSGTYNGVVQAQKIVKDEIEVIPYNTNTVGFSEGYFALEGLRLFKQGASVSEVIQHLDKIKANNTIFFVVNSLTQLIQNGRLTKTKGFLGRFFRVKPILQLNDKGQIVMVQKTFSIEKAFDYIINQIKDYTKGRKYLLYLPFTGNPGLRKDFRVALEKELNLTNIFEMPSSPSLGAHVGNNVVGVGIILQDL
ncbi:MAG: DegV family protein [Candidatus Phytoplasma pruni]|uniref:DegV family protein n=1 Tax=Poinsettia branch-inducing phytoplasma TaxID=138647 RepID=UPI0003691992|nr:DegV family protein [Poinsettia branch-inducing phytoplasma]WEK82256.1 MAG: DegV family protein [Candidatus Phytoplasma pruni]